MNRFWDNLILPIIEQINAKYIVEIGSDTGINTRNILEYCVNNEAYMTAIDPIPQFDVEDFKAKYGDKFEIYNELSLSRLPLLEDYDVILIDGDHNWYTVYNELKIIEKKFKGKNFPIIFLHDVGWPYARRDLYYNPKNIPEKYRQPYKKFGMYPGQTSLKTEGGLNNHLYNSIYENNLKNGVLTALEDFINESDLKLSFEIIHAFHGIGILYPKNSEIENIIKNVDLIKELEKERINIIISYNESKNHNKSIQKELNELQKERTNILTSLKESKNHNKSIQKELKLKKSKYKILYKELRDKNSYFENRFYKINEEQRKLIISYTESKGQIKLLENQVKIIEAQKNNFELAFKESKSYNNFIEEKLNDLEKERSNLVKIKAEKIELENKYIKSDKNNKLLKKEIKEGRNKIKGLENQLKTAISSINEKEKIITQINQKEQELQNTLDEISTDFYMMEYFSNKNRTITQKVFSKFPSLYILFNTNKIGIKNRLINIKGYRALKNSTLFDMDFYIKNNEDIRLSGMDPILHYLYHGFREGRKPNPQFDAAYYLKTYTDVNNSNLNPLVHFALYGKYENRKICENIKKLRKPKNDAPNREFVPHSRLFNRDFSLENNLKSGLNKKYSNDYVETILNVLSNKKISIIIPIYNAYEDTKKCIMSVIENTQFPYELILIDDCSTDKRIGNLLDKLEKIKDVNVIRNKINNGFVKNVNIGIQNSKGDIVLLNSDTIVTPKWLQKLVIAAYSDENIGTVTPFSNASDISVPEIGKNNEIPEFLTLNEMSNLIEKVSSKGNIEAPTGNGFCIFIKRETINDIGVFDEKSFGKGYGEETDFCMRARYKNWKNIRNDSIFIYHKRHASFSENKTQILKKRNKILIKEKYPNIFKEWNAFLSSPEIQDTINNIQVAISANCVSLCKKRVLYVTKPSNRNYPRINQNLIDIQKRFECFILTVDSKNLNIWRYENDKFTIIYQINTKNIKFKNVYFNILITLKIDSIFIQYLGRNHNYIDIAYKLRIPLIYNIPYSNAIKRLENEFKPKLNNLNDLYKFKTNKFNKIAVYTAITGDYDELITPTYINENFDYICFTDNKDLVSDFWEIRLMEDLNLDKVKKARRYKVLPHIYLQEYEYSLWVDANFKIIGDLEDFINKYWVNNHPMMCIIHPERDCIYDEAKSCITLKKDSEEVIESQIEKYKKEAYPKNYGLISSGILFRKHHDPKVIKLMEDWYHEIINNSRRDQLSFNYVCWKNRFDYDKCDILVWRNEFFERIAHKTNLKDKQVISCNQSVSIKN